jgi:hypothetical protein
MSYEKNKVHGVSPVIVAEPLQAIMSLPFGYSAVPCAACASSIPPRDCVYQTFSRSISVGGESKRRRVSRADPAGRETSVRIRSPGPASSNTTSHTVTSSSSPPSRPPPSRTFPQQREAAENAESAQSTTSQAQSAQAGPARYPFFRYLGPTAIAPGRPFRRVSVGVTKGRSLHKKARPSNVLLPSPATENSRPPSQFQPPGYTHAYATSAIRTPPISTSNSANTSRSPSPPFAGLSIPDSIIDTFYEHMSSFLPFIRRDDLATQIARGTASEILLNIMAALAER